MLNPIELLILNPNISFVSEYNGHKSEYVYSDNDVYYRCADEWLQMSAFDFIVKMKYVINNGGIFYRVK